MISEKLANLADHVLGDAVRGRPMPAVECAAMAAVLLDLSIQVRALEHQPVPQRARLPLRRTRNAALPQPEGVAR